ncbi:MAG: radical SAM protein [Methanomassiliicoccales archaeon]
MRTIAVYRPGKAFPSFSVTGAQCQLMCEHCQGRFLKGMVPISGPEELLALAEDVRSHGGTGFLLSGGCDAQGKVPLLPYVDAVRKIKTTTELMVNVHPGLVSEDEAGILASSLADRVSFDLVLDENVIRQRMHLDSSPEDHLRSFRAICQALPGRVAPHILLGTGREERELEAVKEACQEDVPCVILLSLVGEKVDDREGRLLRAVQDARQHGRTVLIGCMRPRGEPDLEMRALEAGAEGIALPSSETLKRIRERGWKVEERRYCCALHR